MDKNSQSTPKETNVIPNTNNIVDQINSTISAMTDISKALSKGMTKIKVKDLVMFKVNIIKFKIALKEVVGVMKDFNELFSKSELQDLISSLLPDSQQQAKLEAMKATSTSEIAKAISEIKEPTVIDVITSVIKLLESITKIPVPTLGNLITLKTKAMPMFKSTVNSIIELLQYISDETETLKSAKTTKMLTIFDKFLDILNKTVDLAKNMAKSLPMLLIARLAFKPFQYISTAIIKQMRKIIKLTSKMKIRDFINLKLMMESMEAVVHSVLVISATLCLILVLAVPALLGLVAFVAIIKSILFIVKLIGRLNKKETQGIKSILILASTFLILATSLYLLSQVVLNPAILLGVMVTLLIIGALIGLMVLISLIKKPIETGVKLIALMCMSLLITTISLVLLSTITASISWEPILMLIVMIGVMVGVLFLLQFIKGPTVRGIMLLILMSVSFLLVSVFMSGAAAITNNIEWDGLLKLVIVISVLALSLFGLSFLTPFIAGGLIAMGMFVAVAVLLLVVTVSLKKVSEYSQSVNLDNIINDQGTGCINQLITMVDSLYDNLSLKFMTKIAFVGANLFLLLGVVTPIAAIANLLRDLSSLSIPVKFNEEGKAIEYTSMNPGDFEAAKSNALTCVETLIGISNLVTKKMEDVSLLGTAKKVMALRMISSLVDPISKTAQLIRELASGRYDEYDSEGKKIGTIDLTTYLTKYKTDIDNNIQALLDVLIGTVKSINIDEDTLEDNVEIMEELNTVIDPIKGLVNMVKSLHEITGGENPIDFDNIKKNIIQCLSIINTIDEFLKAQLSAESKTWLGITVTNTKCFGDIIESVAEELEDLPELTSSLGELIKFVDETNKKLAQFKDEDINKLNDKISKILQVTNGFADIKVTPGNFESIQKTNDKFINSNIKFIDKVNTIDVNKVKTLTQLFEEMTQFSKSINGNFDKLAEFFNEKLLKAIEELKEVLDKYGNTDLNSSTKSSTNWMSKDDGNNNNDSTSISKPENTSSSNDMKSIGKAIENLESVIQEIKNQGIPVYNNIGDVLRVSNI